MRITALLLPALLLSLVDGLRQSGNLTPLLPQDSKSIAVNHSLRGRVFLTGTSKNLAIKVSLTQLSGKLIGTKTLDYDRTFSFENLSPGNYMLKVEQEGDATIARPIQIKGYPSPKIVFLEMLLSGDASATIKELVKEYTPNQAPGREETRTVISPRAASEFRKGIEESQKENHLKAIKHLQKAIREAPNFFEAYNNLGVQYQKLKEWQMAIEAFRKAISLQDDSAKPHINLGNIYLTLSETDAAVESFKTALKFDDASAAAHLALGQIFFWKKDLAVAEEHLETATRLSPSETRAAFLLLVQIQLQGGNTDRAKYFLENLLTYFPNDPDALRMKQNLESQSSAPAPISDI